MGQNCTCNSSFKDLQVKHGIAYLTYKEIEECYLNVPNESAEDGPLDMQTISKKQKEDTELVAHANKHKDLYFEKKLDGHKVIWFSKDKKQRSSKW